MHGVVFSMLRKYVSNSGGIAAWEGLLQEAGLPGKSFLAVSLYPDEDILALVGAASRLNNVSADTVLEGFGKFLAPELMTVYSGLVKPEWGPLEFMENVETAIHKVVRLKNPGAEPARLKCERKGPHEVSITYTSPRHLCSLATGMMHGVGVHYGKALTVTETSCMKKGDAACVLRCVEVQ